MSATSLLLDGQDLDDLYARADELEGWVVRVEKVRRSGVAGLLGARRYELTLDVDGIGDTRDEVSLDPPRWPTPTPTPTPSARVRRSGGLEGVDEPRNVALGEGVTAVTPGPRTPTVGLPARAPVTSGTPSPTPTPASPPTDPAPPTPTPSARARRSGGLEGVDEPRNVALGGISALLAAADDADERLGALAAPAATTDFPSAAVGVPAPPRLDQLERPQRVARPATFPRLGAVLLGTPATDLPAPTTPPLTTATPVATPVPATPVAAPRVPFAPPAARAVPVPERLRALGVPSHLVPPDPAVTSALLSLAARLSEPPALAARAGAVVAVVGADAVVLETCAQMLAVVDAPAVRLVIVGDIDGAPGLPLVEPAVAARVRRESADALVVAAVAATTDVERLDRGAAVLDALRPDQCWAALDGARPRGGLAADLAAAAETVGDLDALAVQGGLRCARPGLLLGLGLPVGWLDGRPATPLAWAALLEDALRRAGADGPRGRRNG